MALIIRSIRCGAVISGAYSPSDSAATSTAGSCPRAMATMDSIITCKSSASRSFFVSGYTLCVSATAPAAIAFQSLSLISTPASRRKPPSIPISPNSFSMSTNRSPA